MGEQKFLQELEKKLWTSANKLLPSLDAAVCKHCSVCGPEHIQLFGNDEFGLRKKF